MSDLREYLFTADIVTDFPVPEGKKVTVTDPGYSKDVWCRMDVELPPGDYIGFYDECTDIGKFNDREIICHSVTASGICSRKEFMENEELVFEKIGMVGVDGGELGFFIDKPDYSNEEWGKLVDERFKPKRDYDIGEHMPYWCGWHGCQGFSTFSGYGDGLYPVYMIRNKERACGLLVVFIDEYTDADDEE